jgi:hypothetical protein
MPVISRIYRAWQGLYTTEEPHRIPTKERSSALVEASNVDITKTGAIQSRSGYDQKVSGDFHSVWATDRIMLAVMNGDLVEVLDRGGSYSTRVIRYGVGSLPMYYEQIGMRSYYSSMALNGYIENGSDNSFTAITMTYKRQLPPGEQLALHKGRLYIVRGNLVIWSDAGAYERYDIRADRSFYRFGHDVTMNKSLGGGLYMSDGRTTFFVSGTHPLKATRKVVLNEGAIKGTAVIVRGVIVHGEIMSEAVIWTTPSGICIGNNEGNVLNLTERRYSMSRRDQGVGLVRRGDLNQYIAILN